jgi:hypothetical protein
VRIVALKGRIAIFLALALAGATGFVAGERVGQRSMLKGLNVQLDDVQTMLTFNHLLEERDLQALLSKHCLEQAEMKVDIRIDKDMELLSEFFAGKLSPSTRKYVSERDAGLEKNLTTFKSKYGNQWSVPACN